MAEVRLAGHGSGVRAAAGLLPPAVLVRVQTELLAEPGEWSEPVQVKVEPQPDGTHDLICKQATERS